MIQMFQTCGMLELWLKPSVGQPPALLYSEIAQMTTSTTLTAAYENARVRKRRLRSTCLTASSRTCCSSPARKIGPMSACVSLLVCVGIVSYLLLYARGQSYVQVIRRCQ